MIEFELVVVMFVSMRNVDHAGVEIDALDIAVKYSNPLQQFSDRAHDVRYIKIARRHLVKHRGKEEEILTIDESYFDIRILRQGLF